MQRIGERQYSKEYDYIKNNKKGRLH